MAVLGVQGMFLHGGISTERCQSFSHNICIHVIISHFEDSCLLKYSKLYIDTGVKSFSVRQKVYQG